MNSINLLPQEKKDNLKERQGLFHLKNIGYMIAVFLLVTVGMLYTEKFYLDGKNKSIDDEIMTTELTSPTGETLSFGSTIRDVNNKITFLNGVQSNYVKWSSYIADLIKLLPDNVSFTQLTISQENSLIQINGKANLRDDFTDFKTNLENSELITELDSPISNLIKREDVVFTLTGKTVIEKYKINK